ncbi:hypothetical protein BGZ54_004104 [Gamsiella multidivaricata]|nr:hypothetical protein BGZ54_004104 [Gamsiella multidivaricata]
MVIAAPTPTHLEKRGWVLDKLRPLFTKAVQTLECGACVAAVNGVKDVAKINKGWVSSVAKELCPSLAKFPADVCNGIVDLYGPVVIDIIMKADISGGDGKIICHAVGGICPAPAITSGTLTFPKPKPYTDSPTTFTRAAASWGDYNCDTPVKLTQDLLKHVPTVANVSFAIMTGDVPPHDIWHETKETVDPIEAHAYSVMASLPAKIYPTVGNHESGPAR